MFVARWTGHNESDCERLQRRHSKACCRLSVDLFGRGDLAIGCVSRIRLARSKSEDYNHQDHNAEQGQKARKDGSSRVRSVKAKRSHRLQTEPVLNRSQ